MLATRFELLQRMPIFGAIREDALQFLLEQTREVKVAAREFFFRALLKNEWVNGHED